MRDPVVRHGEAQRTGGISPEAVAFVAQMREVRAARARRGARISYLTAIALGLIAATVWLFDLAPAGSALSPVLIVGSVTLVLVGFCLSFLAMVRATGGDFGPDADTAAPGGDSDADTATGRSADDPAAEAVTEPDTAAPFGPRDLDTD